MATPRAVSDSPVADGATPADFDAAALAAARRGEPWAQRLFVQCYQRPVYRLCWRMLGSTGREGLASSTAEDVAQDAMVRIVRALPSFADAGPAKLSTWVLTLATRAAIDALRRLRPVTAPLEPDASDSHGRGADDRPDLVAERRAIAAAIGRALDELAPEIRATFVLRAYHELSYPEIAEVLEIDLGTVKSRLWRARAALQARLREVHRG